MNLALVENRPDFVELVLEMGLDVNRFVNHIRLRYLYNNTSETEILKTCLKACNLPLQDISLRKRNLVAAGLVEKAIDPMAEMIMGPNSSSKLFVLSTVVKKLRRKPREDWISLRTVGRLLQEMVGCSFPDVYWDEAELFIWAVLFDRPQMVALFLRLAREPVSLGLIGCNLYEKIAKYLPLYDTDGRLRMITQKLQLEAAILQVVDRCYEASHGKTTYLLDRRSENTDGCTCTELAAQAHCLKFMSSASCQYAVDFEWCAGVKANPAVTICAYFCPLLLLSDKLFIFSTESAVLDDDDDDVEEEAANRPDMHHLVVSNTYSTEDSGGDEDDEDDAGEADADGSDYNADGRLKLFVRIQRFYTAPRTKFYVQFLAYIIFLIFYAYVLLFAFYPTYLSACEIVLMVYLASFFVETIRGVIKSAQQPGTYNSRPRKWITSYSWHGYDIILNITNITSLLLRIGLDTTFIYAKSVSAISYILFFIRLFQLYSAHHKLGPKVQMITQMFKELLIFMLILAVFLVSSGVVMESLLYPYRTEFNASVLLNVVYIPYYRIYGELNLDESNAINSGCTESDGITCPMYNFLVPLLMAIYMITVVVLLINLLIAIFRYVGSVFRLLPITTHWCRVLKRIILGANNAWTCRNTTI
ncbi:unnamed protein product [Schistocephalus solidus]|uniref:Ion_trans domain-containing protein n=1 Tax=Schistocephalus solidus TaxID=70667 RepID=A0A183SJ65_SCHSO|nr:unnamed protein product [Schistocephalus solidus]